MKIGCRHVLLDKEMERKRQRVGADKDRLCSKNKSVIVDYVHYKRSKSCSPDREEDIYIYMHIQLHICVIYLDTLTKQIQPKRRFERN